MLLGCQREKDREGEGGGGGGGGGGSCIRNPNNLKIIGTMLHYRTP